MQAVELLGHDLTPMGQAGALDGCRLPVPLVLETGVIESGIESASDPLAGLVCGARFAHIPRLSEGLVGDIPFSC